MIKLNLIPIQSKNKKNLNFLKSKIPGIQILLLIKKN